MRDRRGREWRIGFSEDLAPGDAGIDLILKVERTGRRRYIALPPLKRKPSISPKRNSFAFGSRRLSP